MLEKGIRVNCVTPGPVWTPLIVSSYPKDEINQFGEEVSFKKKGIVEMIIFFSLQ
jgi:NAD(P)-dependent dehydrogenase (short-subunit alcohol dehydrogenase family)